MQENEICEICGDGSSIEWDCPCCGRTIQEPRNLAKPEALSRPLCDGWRDMQKEPPTTTDEVMFYSRTERIIEIGRYINGKCYGRSGMYRDGQVSAWRELPAPPAFA